MATAKKPAAKQPKTSGEVVSASVAESMAAYRADQEAARAKPVKPAKPAPATEEQPAAYQGHDRR